MFEDRIRWHRFFDSEEALRARIPLGRLGHFKIAGKNVVVAHQKDGLFALRDKCPHQGVSFHGGICTEDKKIVCPVHRYSFDLNTGRGGGMAVETYPLELREDGLFIGFPYLAFSLFSRKKK